MARVRKVKLPAGAMDSSEVDPKHTAAIPELGNLVTASILEPEQEDVVLATTEELGRMDYLELLKFNEEPVTLVIHEDTSEHPIDPVMLSVNGKSIALKRGVEHVVPRKYVECLCNPLAHISTKEVIAENGERASEIRSNRAFPFPFAVTKDDNPLGRKWLTALRRR